MNQPPVAQASLEMLTSQTIFQSPFAPIDVETILLNKTEAEHETSPRNTSDYVCALVLNESGEALILAVPNLLTGQVSWCLVQGEIELGEDPLTAVQRLVYCETGYETEDWTYLSSYLTDKDQPLGVGYFFCAQKVRQTRSPNLNSTTSKLVWLSLKELRYALLDGRIPTLSHAITISLAFLTILK